MNIIITGGCGFIGSHLCEILLKLGHKVLCIDNLITGSLENIKEIINNHNFLFVNYDIKLDTNLFLDKTLDNFKPDQIYHLACPASPIHYQNRSLDTLLTNIYGTNNMLKIAEKYKCRILLTSTSEIYGDPLISPQNEEYWGNVNPIGIRSCYDEGKRVAETLMIEYAKNKNVDIRIARIFNTYGEKLDKNDGRVVSNFIIQALENNPITIYGDGSQTRSFCYISDQVYGLIKLMNYNEYNGPINIGNPNEINMKELAELVLKLTNSKSKIIYMSLPSDDPKKRNPDISKAKKYLNWTPLISLEEGLQNTIKYFKNNIK